MSFLPSNSTYQKIELTADITLYWPFYTPTGSLTITDIMDVSADQDGWKIVLPDATLSDTGRNFILNNISIHSFKVVLQDGISELADITGGEVKFINLTDNTTKNGVWSVLPFGAGQNAITQVMLESSDSSITITGGSIIPPGGTIDFALPESLSNLNNVSTQGFPVIKTTDPLTFGTVELVAGENINITNPGGITGEPVINLTSVVSDLSSLEVGDITLSGSIITSNIVNGNIDMVTNGTGKLNFNGVTIDANNNIANVNNLTVNGTFVNPYLPVAWCVFTDSITGDDNTIVMEKGENVTSITGSGGSYVINFTTPMASINYAVFITVASDGGALPPPIYHGMWTVRDANSLTIAILDASGEYVASIPYGVSVMVMSG